MLSVRYAPGTTRKPEVWSEVHYQPIEGRIILFPAWLLHEVEPNVSEKEGPEGDRISISFNIVQELCLSPHEVPPLRLKADKDGCIR